MPSGALGHLRNGSRAELAQNGRGGLQIKHNEVPAFNVGYPHIGPTAAAALIRRREIADSQSSSALHGTNVVEHLDSAVPGQAKRSRAHTFGIPVKGQSHSILLAAVSSDTRERCMVGPGFTEWTNVAKAKPLYRGHQQPITPRDLGFYDLRVPETRQAQTEMARSAGVEGFCYWHYWFGNGKRLLERPFQEVSRQRHALCTYDRGFLTVLGLWPTVCVSSL